MPASARSSTGFGRTCARTCPKPGCAAGTTSASSSSPSTTTRSVTSTSSFRRPSRAATGPASGSPSTTAPRRPTSGEEIKQAFNGRPGQVPGPHPHRHRRRPRGPQPPGPLLEPVPLRRAVEPQPHGAAERPHRPQAPAEHEVYCHYFVYKQRPEDRILAVLVRKTETIKRELGSLAQVIDARLADTLQAGHPPRPDRRDWRRTSRTADLDADSQRSRSKRNWKRPASGRTPCASRSTACARGSKKSQKRHRPGRKTTSARRSPAPWR